MCRLSWRPWGRRGGRGAGGGGGGGVRVRQLHVTAACACARMRAARRARGAAPLCAGPAAPRSRTLLPTGVFFFARSVLWLPPPTRPKRLMAGGCGALPAGVRRAKTRAPPRRAAAASRWHRGPPAAGVRYSGVTPTSCSDLGALVGAWEVQIGASPRLQWLLHLDHGRLHRCCTVDALLATLGSFYEIAGFRARIVRSLPAGVRLPARLVPPHRPGASSSFVLLLPACARTCYPLPPGWGARQRSRACRTGLCRLHPNPR